LVEETGEKVKSFTANPENKVCLWDNSESLHGHDSKYQINNIQISFKLQRATAGKERMETLLLTGKSISPSAFLYNY